MTYRAALRLCCVATVLAVAPGTQAQPPAAPRPPTPTPDAASSPPTATGDARGRAAYEGRCAKCHLEPGATKAPSLGAMRQMSAAQVYFSLVNGKMRTHAAGLSPEELGALVSYASGAAQRYRPAPSAMCAKHDIELGPRYVTRWGFDARNSGALGADATAINALNVGTLRLVWAFGLPNVADARSQPVVAGDTLFVAAAGSDLFALDRSSGCIKWHYASPVPLRTALTLGTVGAGDGERSLLFFGDGAAFANAVDALDGHLVWREPVGVAPASIVTGGLVLHGNRLVVPISTYEVALAPEPSYECCKSHGAVRLLDATTGKVLWTTHMTPDAEPRGRSTKGTQLWGPSGVPVWSTPTVDPERGVIYVGTGQNASSPPTELSDSVVALDLSSGAISWHFQALAGDAYNDACGSYPKGPNCPVENGNDFDFGASIILARTTSGSDVLIAGQKSGDVYALDPDGKGRVLWHRRVGAGSPLGGIHWGMAVSEGKVYVPVADPQLPRPGYEPKPGLYALSIDDGSVIWERAIERGCETNLMTYFRRETLYPECSFYFGLSAAATALPGVVFAPALDGRVRAFATADGSLLWSFDTARPFETTNGVDAHGGSIDSAGVQAAGRMVYVQSGYALFGQLPGNALLAFEVGG